MTSEAFDFLQCPKTSINKKKSKETLFDHTRENVTIIGKDEQEPSRSRESGDQLLPFLHSQGAQSFSMKLSTVYQQPTHWGFNSG